jgi:Ser/Thr protein kinase RdoA (MazF antagonist)
MDRNKALSALGHFNIEPLQYHLHPINQGFINDTFRVSSQGKNLFVLQRLNTSVFPKAAGVMDNLGKLLPLLQGDGYQPLQLFQVKSGENFHIDRLGDFWRLLSYVPDSTTFNTTTDRGIAFEAGRILGKFHNLLQGISTTQFEVILPNFHTLEKRIEEFEAALKNASGERLKKAAKTIHSIRENLNRNTLDVAIEVPLRICHNDTKLNNILFSKTTGKALCLIDLDTVMQGYFHYDFGDAVRTVVNPAPEDEPNLDTIAFDLELFKAMVKGLQKSGIALSDTEKKLLSYGPVLMPYLHGIRAVTDYLNKDIYYKVAFQDQNLKRGSSLLTFSQKAFENKASMDTIIEEILGR